MNEWNGSSCVSDAVIVTQARKTEISEWKIGVVNDYGSIMQGYLLGTGHKPASPHNIEIV